MLALGYTQKQAAEELGLSRQTVKNYLAQAKREIDVENPPTTYRMVALYVAEIGLPEK
jgi:DNA-binding NarL/FixJ family response regulator